MLFGLLMRVKENGKIKRFGALNEYGQTVQMTYSEVWRHTRKGDFVNLAPAGEFFTAKNCYMSDIPLFDKDMNQLSGTQYDIYFNILSAQIQETKRKKEEDANIKCVTEEIKRQEEAEAEVEESNSLSFGDIADKISESNFLKKIKKGVNRKEYLKNLEKLEQLLGYIEHIGSEIVNAKTRTNNMLIEKKATQYSRQMDATTSDANINKYILDYGIMQVRNRIVAFYNQARQIQNNELTDNDKNYYVERLSSAKGLCEAVIELHKETSNILKNNVKEQEDAVEAEKQRVEHEKDVKKEIPEVLEELQKLGNEFNSVKFETDKLSELTGKLNKISKQLGEIFNNIRNEETKNEAYPIASTLMQQIEERKAEFEDAQNTYQAEQDEKERLRKEEEQRKRDEEERIEKEKKHIIEQCKAELKQIELEVDDLEKRCGDSEVYVKDVNMVKDKAEKVIETIQKIKDEYKQACNKIIITNDEIEAVYSHTKAGLKSAYRKIKEKVERDILEPYAKIIEQYEQEIKGGKLREPNSFKSEIYDSFSNEYSKIQKIYGVGFASIVDEHQEKVGVLEKKIESILELNKKLYTEEQSVVVRENYENLYDRIKKTDASKITYTDIDSFRQELVDIRDSTQYSDADKEYEKTCDAVWDKHDELAESCMKEFKEIKRKVRVQGDIILSGEVKLSPEARIDKLNSFRNEASELIIKGWGEEERYNDWIHRKYGYEQGNALADIYKTIEEVTEKALDFIEKTRQKEELKRAIDEVINNIKNLKITTDLAEAEANIKNCTNGMSSDEIEAEAKRYLKDCERELKKREEKAEEEEKKRIEGIKEANTAVIRKIISELKKANSLDIVNELANEYESASKEYVNKGDTDEAEKLIESKRRECIQKINTNIISNIISKLKDVKTLDEVKSIEAEYNSVSKEYVSAIGIDNADSAIRTKRRDVISGIISSSVKLLQDMLDEVKTLEDIRELQSKYEEVWEECIKDTDNSYDAILKLNELKLRISRKESGLEADAVFEERKSRLKLLEELVDKANSLEELKDVKDKLYDEIIFIDEDRRKIEKLIRGKEHDIVSNQFEYIINDAGDEIKNASSIEELDVISKNFWDTYKVFSIDKEIGAEQNVKKRKIQKLLDDRYREFDGDIERQKDRQCDEDVKYIKSLEAIIDFEEVGRFRNEMMTKYKKDRTGSPIGYNHRIHEIDMALHDYERSCRDMKNKIDEEERKRDSNFETSITKRCKQQKDITQSVLKSKGISDARNYANNEIASISREISRYKFGTYGGFEHKVRNVNITLNNFKHDVDKMIEEEENRLMVKENKRIAEEEKRLEKLRRSNKLQNTDSIIRDLEIYAEHNDYENEVVFIVMKNFIKVFNAKLNEYLQIE